MQNNIFAKRLNIVLYSEIYGKYNNYNFKMMSYRRILTRAILLPYRVGSVAMKFILSDTVYYSPDDRRIWFKDEDSAEGVELTPIPGRILLLLIENQGSIVTRDIFFELVWDRYGKTGSSNTLKQYIGLLRKILEKYTGVECIITVPGEGYSFTSGVTIERVTTETIISHNLDCEHEPQLKKTKIYTKKKSLLIITILVLIIFAGMFFIVPPTHFLVKNNISLSDTCRVIHLIDDEALTSDKNTKEAINNIIIKQNIKCTPDAQIFYYSNEEEGMQNNNAFKILAVCKKDNSRVLNCTTYRNNW